MAPGGVGDPGSSLPGGQPEWPSQSGPGRVWSGLTEHLQQRCCVARATGSKRFVAWEGHVHTATFKTDNQQGPAAQHRGLCSALGASLGGRGVWLHVHLHVWLSLDCSPEPTATFLTGFTPIQNKKFVVWGVENPQPFVLVLPAAATSRCLGFKSKPPGTVAHCLFASSFPPAPGARPPAWAPPGTQ